MRTILSALVALSVIAGVANPATAFDATDFYEPSRGAWSKAKCPRWHREHAERWRVFEKAKPGLTEGERALKKKTEELSRCALGHGEGAAQARGHSGGRDRRARGAL